MKFEDYYAALGVERSASIDEIKKSYRRLARKYHPDLNSAPDASAKMQAVNEAYAVLGDPEKRAAYDKLGEPVGEAQDFQPPPDWDAGFEFAGGPEASAGDHSAFFDALFGAARRGSGRRRPAAADFAVRGEDHHAKVLIAIEDAFTGATRTLTLQSPHVDDQGRVTLQQRQLSVTIPRGVRAGQQLRLAGQGTPGFNGGPAGDLYLEIQFETHPRYRVDGRDLYLTLPVAPWEAALGGPVPVTTPDGTVELTIPAGSQAGRKLRLRERGIPGDPRGDLYVQLAVVLPPATSDAARVLYRQMAKDMAFDPRASEASA